MNQTSKKRSKTSKDVKDVLVALLLTMFVAMTSVTIVGNALPTIISQLHGSETDYTWIVTAMLLASTVATPIFGRLGDLFDKKLMMQIGIGTFALGSLLSGFVTSTSWLIATRVIQGFGMGAQQAMAMTLMATILPPRERGRYNGYFGAVMAGATVSGPLIGGFIVATPWLGWRWCFWLLVPFCLVGMYIFHRKLHLPPMNNREKPAVDYWGAATITVAVSLILIWLTMVTKYLPILSWQTFVMLGIALVATVAFFVVESHHPQPVVPLWLLKTPSTLLAIMASVVVGTVLNAPPVFLGQYFQVARGMNPAVAGLAMLPLMIGSFVFSTWTGQMVSRRGRWKRYVVGGTIIMFVGTVVLSFTTETTPMWVLWLGMFLVGSGQGAAMQNMVLAVQNLVPLKDIGAASATVAFFRSLGGAVGVQLVGAIFAWRSILEIKSRALAAGIPLEHTEATIESGSMSFQDMPENIAQVVRSSYGAALGWNFMFLAGMSFVAVLMVSFMKSTKLRDTVDLEQAEVKQIIAAGRDRSSEGSGQDSSDGNKNTLDAEDPASQNPNTGKAGQQKTGPEKPDPSSENKN